MKIVKYKKWKTFNVAIQKIKHIKINKKIKCITIREKLKVEKIYIKIKKESKNWWLALYKSKIAFDRKKYATKL